MPDRTQSKPCVQPDASAEDFWSERRRFLNGLLPVRRHTVSITFQKGAHHRAAASRTARLAV